MTYVTGVALWARPSGERRLACRMCPPQTLTHELVGHDPFLLRRGCWEGCCNGTVSSPEPQAWAYCALPSCPAGWCFTDVLSSLLRRLRLPVRAGPGRAGAAWRAGGEDRGELPGDSSKKGLLRSQARVQMPLPSVYNLSEVSDLQASVSLSLRGGKRVVGSSAVQSVSLDGGQCSRSFLPPAVATRPCGH